MNETATYPLRLHKPLKEGVTKAAKRNGTSVNQFIAIAVAEKICALETEQFFTERAKGAGLNAFREILFRHGGDTPRAGDGLDG